MYEEINSETERLLKRDNLIFVVGTSLACWAWLFLIPLINYSELQAHYNESTRSNVKTENMILSLLPSFAVFVLLPVMLSYLLIYQYNKPSERNYTPIGDGYWPACHKLDVKSQLIANSSQTRYEAV